MAEGQEWKKKIIITVKTTKDKKTLEIVEDTNIKDVCNLLFECMRFIFLIFFFLY